MVDSSTVTMVSFSLKDMNGTIHNWMHHHGRALVMGLMLHAKARSMLEQGNYQEALEVLGMSEVCNVLIHCYLGTDYLKL